MAQQLESILSDDVADDRHPDLPSGSTCAPEDSKPTPFSIFNAAGQRKYLNRSEMRALLRVAATSDTETHSFVRFIAETGCRISEALAMRLDRVDLDNGIVVIESLKKRRTGIFRTVPISPELCALIGAQGTTTSQTRIWNWSRMTAWRKLRQIFDACGLDGVHATPRGLRHGFATAAVTSGVPLPIIQRWMGHADIRTTTIYMAVQGPEERAFADQMRTDYYGQPADEPGP